VNWGNDSPRFPAHLESGGLLEDKEKSILTNSEEVLRELEGGK